MKRTTVLLPLACGVAALAGHALPAFAQTEALRVEPVVSVRHAEPAVDAWYTLGRHHQAANRLDLAAEAYRQAIAGQAQHVEARNALASVYSLQNRFDEAIAQFQALLQENPGLSHVHNNLGYTYYLQTHYRNAIGAFGRAISLDPGNTVAIGNLALAYARLAESGDRGADPATAPPPMAASAEPPAPAPAAAKDDDTASAPAPVPANASGEHKLRGIEIEIANGTRNTQLGEDLAKALRGEGAVVTRVAALRPYTQRRNVILYRDGYYKQALILSQSFTIPPAVVNNTRTRSPSDKSTVRLVLGKAALQSPKVAGAATGAASL